MTGEASQLDIQVQVPYYEKSFEREAGAGAIQDKWDGPAGGQGLDR